MRTWMLKVETYVDLIGNFPLILKIAVAKLKS